MILGLAAIFVAVADVQHHEGSDALFDLNEPSVNLQERNVLFILKWEHMEEMAQF